MTKTLIVGVNGFLASKLAERLKGNILVGLMHKNDFRVNRNIYSKIYNEINLLVKEEKYFNIIYLFGSYIPYGKFDNPDIEYVTNNIKLVIDLSLAFPTSRFIFSSSIAVYGQPCEEIIKLNTPFNNPSLYGLSKIAGEAIIKNFKSYAILRFSSIWGKGCNENTFIPRLIKQALDKKIITLYGDGSRKQNYIHYEDAIEMCLQVADLEENLVLLGVGTRNYTNLEIANAVAAYTGALIQFINEDTSPKMAFEANSSFEKIGYWPKKDIIKDFIELL
jgi:nucleoside-diphosphate-sugar epimerase